MLVLPRVTTTRRTALGGAAATLGVGVGALAGCDLDPDSSGPESSDEPTTGPSADPDTGLVDTVLAELRELTDLVSGVAAAHPGLSRAMTGLRDLHLAHREALSDESVDEPAGGGQLDPRTGPTQALALVRGRERRTQGRLADWSVAAESGALARLFACMSAGVAQQLAVLPATAGAGA
ncbi:MAG TPA: hypothetical protein VFT00_04810 [Nocardioides sp.]|nr:hypothetical protein [Nocardioides sp.]